MRYRWQSITGGVQLLDAITGQVIHRAVGAGIVTPPSSDDPRIALQGISSVSPPVPGSAWINNIGQLIQKVGTDELFYIDGELYEKLPNGSYFKVTTPATVSNQFILLAFLAGAAALWFIWSGSK